MNDRLNESEKSYSTDNIDFVAFCKCLGYSYKGIIKTNKKGVTFLIYPTSLTKDIDLKKLHSEFNTGSLDKKYLPQPTLYLHHRDNVRKEVERILRENNDRR